jgi:alpha-amylase
LATMQAYLSHMPRQFSLFDCPLVYNFSSASKAESADLTKIFDDTLVGTHPINAVTLVQNHDTQHGQALEIPMEEFFKPLAYALILLRLEGYPCVFYGDLYGVSGPDAGKPPSCGGKLGDMILARKLYAYGEEDSYFDFPTCVGWVRRGTHDRKDGCAIVLSNAGPGEKRMFVGEVHKGETWTDVVCVLQNDVNCSWDGAMRRSRLETTGLGILFVVNVL